MKKYITYTNESYKLDKKSIEEIDRYIKLLFINVSIKFDFINQPYNISFFKNYKSKEWTEPIDIDPEILKNPKYKMYLDMTNIDLL